MGTRLMLAAVVLTGCLEETERVQLEPECSAGQRECISYRQARSCANGFWQTEPECEAEEICEGTEAECHEGAYTCLGVLLCNFDCPDNDKQCTDACNEGATRTAVDALLELNQCQCAPEAAEDECWPWLCGHFFPIRGAAEIAACVAKRCPAEGAECVGKGLDGDAACNAVRTCILDDCHGDTFCSESCFAQGDQEAQTIAGFYYACLRDACGATPTSPCLAEAQSGDCATQWQACTDDIAGQASVPDLPDPGSD